MPTPILIIAHAGIGDALLKVAQQVTNPLPTEVAVLDVPFACDAEQLYRQAKEAYQSLQKDEKLGVLVLTDLPGSTPANIATRLCQEQDCCLVSGVNMPMLLRALNYCHEDAQSLAAKAKEGGQVGIQNLKAGQ